MLILVGVTINFALNGGIISKSKQAAAAMQKAADLEELQLAVISAMDYTTGQVVRDDLVSSLSSGWNVTNAAPYTCTSPSSNVFTVTADGRITAEGESSGGGNTTDEDLAYLRTYIGTDIKDLIDNFETLAFKDSNMTMSQAEIDDVLANLSSDDIYDDKYLNISYPVYYKNKPYTFLVKQDISEELGEMTILDVTTRTVTPTNSSSSGSSSDSSSEDSSLQYVRMNGIDYIVFGEDTINGTVDLISADALSNVSLGYQDSNAISNATDLNNSGDIDDWEISVYSYNNMVETLVTACKNATGLTVDGTNVISIRSVGNNNVKYTNSGITGSDNPGTYVYDYQTAGAQSDWYTANGYNSYSLKAGDDNYNLDWSNMGDLDIRVANNNVAYWIASRGIVESGETVYFKLRCASDEIIEDWFVSVSVNQSIGTGTRTEGVRPIVTINSSLLNNTSGSGTSADPYVIN